MSALETQNAPEGGFLGGAAEDRPRRTAFRKSKLRKVKSQVFLIDYPSAIYDGMTRMGAFAEVGSRHFQAFDAAGELIGEHPTRQAALAAVSDLYRQRPL